MQAKLEVSNLIKPILEIYKGIENEFSNLLKSGLYDYLNNQTGKYYYTNNFLHRGQKILFFKNYFPILVKHKLLLTNFSKSKNVLEEYKDILIIGTAGSGKSTLSKYIFLSSLKECYKIPIFIELRHLNNSSIELEEYLIKTITNKKAKPSYNITKRYLKKGAFLFIFDGYDEIYSKFKQKLTKQIEEFMDQYPLNNYIMTTRPSIDIEFLPRFKNFYVQDLTKEEVVKFIHQMVTVQERKTRLLTLVNNSNKVNNYFNYLQNPLLLSMFILAFEKHPEIPQKHSSFYSNVFDTLYSQHDGITKGSFPRERKTQLYKEDLEEVLKTFCFLTYMKNEYSFTSKEMENTMKKIKSYKPNIDFKLEDMKHDLITSISILVKEGFEYKFPHRSMQEYFAALFISTLNPNKKTIAYNSMLKETNSFFSTNSDLFFWNLCFELDEIGMTKYFIIPKLTNIFNSLSKANNNEEKVQIYINLLGVKFESIPTLMPTEDDDSYTESFCLVTQVNEVSYILKYTMLFPGNSYKSLTDSELNRIEIIQTSEKSIKRIDKEVFAILMASKFPKIVYEFYENIEKKLIFYKTKIKEEEEGVNKILGIEL